MCFGEYEDEHEHEDVHEDEHAHDYAHAHDYGNEGSAPLPPQALHLRLQRLVLGRLGEQGLVNR